MILDEGKEEGVREVILFVGENRLGAADEPVKDGLKSITDLARLKRMALKAHTATSWQNIFETE